MGIKGKDKNKTKQKLVKELEKALKKGAKLEKEQKKFKKIKEELRAERDKFRGIISSISDGLDIIDKNYRICFQNKILIDRFGDLTGKLCFKAYMKRQVPCDFCLIRKAIKTKKPQKVELTAPDGRIYELTSTPFKDIDGKTKVIEIVHDITKLKETDRQIKENEERFRELFDHMSSGVAVYEAIDNGKDFIFKDLNSAGEKFDNLKREVIIGRGILEVFPGVKEYGLFKILKRVWKTGKPESHPISLYKDNRIAGWRENYVYKLPSGEIVTIYDDITKRKQDEEKIEESEERFRKSIMNAPLPIMIHKENGKVISINEAWTEITGYTEEEIPTIEAWTKKAYGKKKRLMRDGIDRLYKINKRVDEGEFEIKTKSGDKRIWHFSSAPLGKAPDGGRLVISMALDVTERKEREEEYKNLINSMNDTAFVIDFKGKFIDVNDTAVKFLGYSREELLSMGPVDIDPVLSAKDIAGLIEGMKMDEKQVFETAHKTKSGKIIPVEVSSSLVTYKGKPVILSIARDITERKKAEEDLRKSEERFQTILENLPHGAFVHDLNGKITLVNKATTELTGYTKEKLLKMKASDIGRDRKNIWLKLQKKGGFFRGETTFLCKDGTKLPVEIHAGAVTLGKTPMIIAIAHDITERKKALEKLKESEERFQTVIENIPHSVSVHDLDGNFIMVNEAQCRQIGYTRDEHMKMKVTDIDPHIQTRDDRKNIWLKLNKGSHTHFESELLRKDGSRYPVEIYLSAITLEGKPMILAIGQDISERKKALEDLQKSEDQLSVVFNNASDILLLLSVENGGDFRVVRVNKTAIDTARNLGLDISNESFAGKTLREAILNVIGLPEKVFNNALKRIKETVKTGNPGAYDESYNFGNETFYSEVTTVPISDQEGNCVYVLLTPHDVTKTKKTLEALQESEERFQTVIENLPDEIFVNDLDGKFIMVNKASCEKTGYTKEELLNMNVGDIDHESVSRDDRKNIWEKFQKEGGFERIESTHYRKDGSSYPAEIYIGSVTFKGSPMIIVIAHDITERKKAIEKLIESEERFQTVIKNLPHGVMVHDLDGNFTMVNKVSFDLTGYTEEELLNMKIKDIDHATFIRGDKKKFWLKLKKGGGFARIESTHYRKDGTSYPAEIYINAISLKGEPMIVGIAHDITERKKALEKLQKSEEKYRNLYESMMDAFIRTDMQGNILEFNKQYSDMLGYSEDEIKKLKYTDLTPEKWHEMEMKIKKEQVVKRGYSDVYEKEYIKKDGTIFPVELRGFLLRDDNGNPQGMWAIVRDITERKNIEEELRKIERLESLGILAGGIAHDFNNLLTGILGNLSLVQAEEGEDFWNTLEEAKQASIQAKNLTQQLLTFSKGGEPIKGTVSIEDIISDSAEFSLHGSNVRCECRFAHDLWKVKVDKGQISQVIDNLVINANQAMPEGGKIHIKAENVILGKENLLNLSEGKYVKITLQDQGIGMPEEYLPKIFDPYFSTKQEGSGLGLATVYSIIQKHAGYITVESQTGKGTSFFIYLPAIEEKISKKKEKKETKETLTGEGKILIMDDEKIVRRAVGGMLRSLGYTVELAEKGEEAIVKYKEAQNSKKPFDAVILDLTVPGGLGGKKTMEKLLQIDPDVKAIVSSGYSTDPVMANYEKHGFKSVVAKPFDLEELNKAIEKALK